jgi:hypothetical protein
MKLAIGTLPVSRTKDLTSTAVSFRAFVLGAAGGSLVHVGHRPDAYATFGATHLAECARCKQHPSGGCNQANPKFFQQSQIFLSRFRLAIR